MPTADCRPERSGCKGELPWDSRVRAVGRSAVAVRGANVLREELPLYGVAVAVADRGDVVLVKAERAAMPAAGSAGLG